MKRHTHTRLVNAVLLRPGLLIVIGVIFGISPIRGHHAFGGEFDPAKPVRLTGPVTKIEWVNPHAWIHIAVKNPDGSSKTWMIEGGTPNTLLRRGITRESLKIGTVLVIDGYQARDHSQPRANGRNVTLPDGRKLFLGSSGTGAPSDGADPNEPAKGRGRGRP
jgi:hypothetical protein